MNSAGHSYTLRPRTPKPNVERPPSPTTCAISTLWRGRTGRQILEGERMRWTPSDWRLFRIYAARYQWSTAAAGIPMTELKELQKELLVYTGSRRLNQVIADKLHSAVVYDLGGRLPGAALGWPRWTQRWFLDPTWDGDANPPLRQPVTPFQWVSALGFSWTHWWTPPDRQRVFLLLRLLDHHCVDGDALLLLGHALDSYIRARSRSTATVVSSIAPPSSSKPCSLSPIVTVYESAPDAEDASCPQSSDALDSSRPPSPPNEPSVASSSFSSSSSLLSTADLHFGSPSRSVPDDDSFLYQHAAGDCELEQYKRAKQDAWEYMEAQR
ncbi:hypothetical protein IWZ03DRAFT_123891 [Phyllosticta citriasiana]|uniref:Uncharacterized protein n=1 Tax=Phyllosticta citriasiana TaxID=595635 RepID=A0ABR1KCY1_9PEZI